MSGEFVFELLSIAFVTGHFVSAVKASQASLEKTQVDQTLRFNKLEVKVDNIADRLSSLKCITGAQCRERI